LPNVRGHFIPEIENTGRAKQRLDVLLWGNGWSAQDWAALDEIEILRDYLSSIQPPSCGIRLFVPANHDETSKTLRTLNASFVLVKTLNATPDTLKSIEDEELAGAVQTALAYDADVLVVSRLDWLPFIESLGDLGLFLSDLGFLKHYCEVFVRGHDVPWAFTHRIWNQPWNGFYQMAEHATFGTGLNFLREAYEKKVNAEAQEAGRSLIYNRLANICFTRDRLLFYDMQTMAAERAKWRRQRFLFEVGYYLNFYYPLIFGGFDHIALLVNQTLQLGLAEKNVGATYQGFLDALRAKNATLHAAFTDPKQVEFTKRIGYLRHYASHRGALAPGKLIERPEKELSDDEADAMIAESGTYDWLLYLPEGKIKEEFKQSIRHVVKMDHYEKTGKPIDGVVPIVVDGKSAFIRPITDTYWNFTKFLNFMNSVLTQLKASI
jgi:hypothetical protein